MKKYVIWSNEHQLWWRPNSNGYTPWLEDAGVYDAEEATQICEAPKLETVKTSLTDIPPGIKAAWLAILKATEATKRSESAPAEGEAPARSWASVDDVFAALRDEMAKEDLIFELCDGGFELVPLGGRVFAKAIYRPVWTCRNERYAPTEGDLHAVAEIEGNGTAAAMRTSTERAYLKSTFKLPSAADPAASKPQAARPIVAAAPAEDEAEAGRKIVPKPGQMPPAESGAKATEIVGEIDKAETVAEIERVWRSHSQEFTRLNKAAQTVVRTAMKRRETELSEQAA